MKKLGLLFTVLLMGLATVSASEKTSEKLANDLDINTRYSYMQPIRFVERGVEFLIFPDGSYDFNTHMQSSYYSGDVYYRSSTTRRSSVNTTYGAPRTTINRVRYSQPRNTGVLIEHDANGKVRRIGNVFINYDRLGKIKRAGSVYMSYNRGNGLLSQVGGLHINYNGWGQVVYTSGTVNQNNTGFGYTNTYTNSGHNSNDWHTNDNDFFYYKQDSNIKSKEKSKGRS